MANLCFTSNLPTDPEARASAPVNQEYREELNGFLLEVFQTAALYAGQLAVLQQTFLLYASLEKEFAHVHSLEAKCKKYKVPPGIEAASLKFSQGLYQSDQASPLELLCSSEEIKILNMCDEYRLVENHWTTGILQGIPAIFAHAVAKELFSSNNLVTRLWQVIQVSREGRCLAAIPDVLEDLYKKCLSAISLTEWAGERLTNSITMEVELRRPLQKYFKEIPNERR